MVALATGDLARAESLATRSLELSRAIGFEGGTALSLYDLGQVAFASDDPMRAAPLLAESLDLLARRSDRWYMILPLAGLAEIAANGGDLERAARLAGALDAQREQLGVAIWRSVQPQVERVVALARARLGEEAFAVAWGSGRALAPAEAVAEAAAVPTILAAPRAAPVAPADRFGLTPREVEVLRLLAGRLTDREIAEALFISPHTAARHVASILGKLGAANRREAAAAAARLGLDQATST